MSNAALAQYGLAAVTLICAVVVNIFGKESEALNSLLATVIVGALWGGVQRHKADHPHKADNKNPAE